ncbi:MAG: IS4 family transposase [Proteobacteria bacterium]|nr:IS4 family transposase [Pseudomonadota bacterium]
MNKDSFNKLVQKFESNKHSKGNDAWSHFVTMVFCQFSKSNSLNDICNGMRSATGDLNHLGVTKAMRRSSLAYNNQHRNWELFQSMYFDLYDRFESKLKKSRKLLPKRKIYLLDSTTIDLCLKVFDWALFRKKKGAIKLHTVLDFDGCMPVFADLSDGKKHDVKAAHEIEFPTGSIVVADRAYVDFKWMKELNEQSVFFVIRGKENIKLELTERLLSSTDEKNPHLQYDWQGYLSLPQSKAKYPMKLRMVQVWDPEQEIYLELLTNNFTWTATTISELYKRRWNIESFFKEIKTHLKIKSFIGTSMNAVLIQIWTALITILLLKTLQREAKYKWHLSNLVSYIRLNLFVKKKKKKWLDKPFLDDDEIDKLELQLSLF